MAAVEGGNLPKIRKQNVSLIKEVIYKYGPLSRSDVAEMLALTPPTITTSVAKLIKKGLVEECPNSEPEQDEKTLGRRRVNLVFVPHSYYYVGAELGPYSTMLCVTDLRGTVLIKKQQPEPSHDYSTMLDELAGYISELMEESGIERQCFHGVAVGVPGFINQQDGVIRSSLRSDWNSRCFAQELSQKLGVQVKIENNVQVRAIGAEMFRAAALRDVDTLAYYFISAGIACPILIKNTLASGYTAGAGEVGHMVVELNGAECKTCGNRGCLEAIAGEKAIMDSCRAIMKSGEKTLLTELCKDIEHPQMSEILQAQRLNDIEVQKVLHTALTYLGVTLANIINFISPQTVFVEGYIFTSEQLREQFHTIAKKNLSALHSREVNIVYVEHDPFSGAIGAAAMAIKEFFIKSEDEE